MYKLCKTEQSAARQRQLEKGLLDAMLVNWVPKLVRNSVEIDSFLWALAVSLVINALRLAVDVFFDKDKDRDRD